MHRLIPRFAALLLLVPLVASAAPQLTGPLPGQAFLGGSNPAASMAANDYSETEYFFSGAATSYALAGGMPDDGAASATAADKAPFTSRLIVRRPADTSKFNGILVVEWLNVSGLTDAAPDFGYLHRHLLRDGYAWVGISAQQAGVDGMAEMPVNRHLKAVNPERYGELSHPGDAFAFDIFTQGAQLAADPATGILGGATPDQVLAIGESQSAFALVTYVNAVDPLAAFFDGFLIHARGGNSLPLDGVRLGRDDPRFYAGRHRIRDDVRVPVLTVQSETDVVTLESVNARQADSDKLRLWEIAGAAHADTYLLKASAMDHPGVAGAELAAALQASDQVMGMETALPVNAGPQQHYILQAALHQLRNWVVSGDAPPVAPRLWLADTAPVTLAADGLGQALGGIRSPWTEAPLALHSGLGQSGEGFAFLFGTTAPLSAPQLQALYPKGLEDYMAAFTTATDAAIAAGFILPADRDEILALGEAQYHLAHD